MNDDLRAPPRSLEMLLTVAATALGIAFFASVPYWPRDQMTNPIPGFISQALAVPAEKVQLRGPSVLASARPAPELNLSLPDDIATVARRTGINGETGLIPTAASITTFRLRATGDLVSVAAPTGVGPIVPALYVPDPGYRVRGYYAVATTDRGNTVLRWTEGGVTYEIPSRTLHASRLTETASNLR